MMIVILIVYFLVNRHRPRSKQEKRAS